MIVLLAAAPAGAGFSDPPVPAPGQELPPHAAGGWPTETTDDDLKPGRTPEQQARLDAVTNELKRIANAHGPDSVVLQSKLLMRSMAAGAIGATEVRVAGPSEEAGADHLEIDVETGLFFVEETTTAEARRDQVWREVAVPVLEDMVSFKIDPGSLELVFLFDVQDSALLVAGAPDPTAESRHEAFRARLDRDLLEDLAGDRVAAAAAHDRVRFVEPATVPHPARPSN